MASELWVTDRSSPAFHYGSDQQYFQIKALIYANLNVAVVSIQAGHRNQQHL